MFLIISFFDVNYAPPELRGRFALGLTPGVCTSKVSHSEILILNIDTQKNIILAIYYTG